MLSGRLTVKLRGRTEAPAHGAEGAQFLSARGAKPAAPHGPQQRLLGGSPLIRNETMLPPADELLLEPREATFPQKPNFVPSLSPIKSAHATGTAEASKHTANAVERNVNPKGD